MLQAKKKEERKQKMRGEGRDKKGSIELAFSTCETPTAEEGDFLEQKLGLTAEILSFCVTSLFSVLG